MTAVALSAVNPVHFSEAIVASERWLSQGIAVSLSRLHGCNPEMFPRKLKALCETSFLEYCVSEHPSASIRAVLRPALAEIWESGELFRLCRYNLAHANLFLPLFSACLAALDASSAQRADIATLAGLAARYRKERLPFRTLDLLHGLYQLTGNEEYRRQLLVMAQYGCLGRLETPFDLDEHDDYALTHTIFYVTNFGKCRWPRSLAKVMAVESCLDIFSGHAEVENNLDLIGEYLLCRQMLSIRGARYREELELVLRAVEPDGFWPGPADLSEALRAIAEPHEQLFFEHYHTTLVVREALLREVSQ